MLAAGVVALAGCREKAPAADTPPQPRSAFAQVNGVRLNYLDWGGSGPGLVFVHGLGDSPHAFDAIAPAFRDSFHVIAYARRAHGRSEVKGPYDHGTTAQDLRELLDSLHIQRVVLAGWSLGGNEISEFAAAYPDRVMGVVFLECYDLGAPGTAPLLGHWPLNSTPGPADLASRAAFRAFWKRISIPNAPLTPAMDAEIADIVNVRPDSSVQVVTSDSITNAFFQDAMGFRSPWARIRAPVLAIWGRWYRGGVVPSDAPDSLQQKVDAFLRDYARPFQDSAAAEMRAAQPSARIVLLDSASHAVFPMQKADTIVGLMRPFLTGLRR